MPERINDPKMAEEMAHVSEELRSSAVSAREKITPVAPEEMKQRTIDHVAHLTDLADIQESIAGIQYSLDHGKLSTDSIREIVDVLKRHNEWGNEMLD